MIQGLRQEARWADDRKYKRRSINRPHLSQSRAKTRSGGAIARVPCRVRGRERGKSQIPVVEQALETAARMLGSDKSRGYCLEMICADFLAGVSGEAGDTEGLVTALSRYFRLMPHIQQLLFRDIIDAEFSKSAGAFGLNTRWYIPVKSHSAIGRIGLKRS